jgi:glucose-1-phosphate thymidylyltransferase
LGSALRRAAELESGGIVFAYPVNDPERYGVVGFDEEGRALSIVEKPDKPRSRYAVPGIYFFDSDVVNVASRLVPSERGELEITDVQRHYLERGSLHVEVLGRGTAWLDAGTHEALLQAASFVHAVQERQGMMIACPEEIAWRMGYISNDQLRAEAELMSDNGYREYLIGVLSEREAVASRP